MNKTGYWGIGQGRLAHFVVGIAGRIGMVALVASSVACSKKQELPEISIEPAGKQSIFARDYLSFADTKQLSQRSVTPIKYYLIAGSGHNANFAQEILEQKRYLLQQGVAESEIACFFSIPNDEDFVADQKQYTQLAAELKQCYPAAPSLVWRLIVQGGQARDFVYVYVTSHGSTPLSKRLEHPKATAQEKAAIQSWLDAFPKLDQFFLSMDATEDGGTTTFGDELPKLQLHQRVSRLLFSPLHLRTALEQGTDSSTKKHVVVQACYSGGFIRSDDAEQDAQALRHLENVSVMTAARPDRTSFGCDPGGERTYFGGAFTDALVASGKLPHQLDWDGTYRSVKSTVEQLETDTRARLSPEEANEFLPSEPLFYQNIRGTTESWLRSLFGL